MLQGALKADLKPRSGTARPASATHFFQKEENTKDVQITTFFFLRPLPSVLQLEVLSSQ